MKGQTAMCQWVTAVPDAVDRWKKQGATVYLVVTSVAAWTVVASTATGLRPSEVFARISAFVGITPVARWLTVEAPEVIAGSSAAVREALLLAVAFVAVILAMRVLRCGRGRVDGTWREASIVMTSRSCATPWLLVLFAVQQEPFRIPLIGTEKVLAGTAGVVAVLIVTWSVVCILIHRIGLQPLTDLFALLTRGFWRVLGAFLVLPGGMMLSLLGPVLVTIGWLFQLEPDRRRDAERERVEREKPPTGAIRSMTSLAGRPF